MKKKKKVINDPSQDLASLLITPVQRIPRYLLLLRGENGGFSFFFFVLKTRFSGIIKKTPLSNPDYENLAKAANEVEKVIAAIDQNVKGKLFVVFVHFFFVDHFPDHEKTAELLRLSEFFHGIPGELFEKEFSSGLL